MALPLQLPWEQAQTKWKSQIDPALASPLNNVTILKDVVLIAGTNVVNHTLGAIQQGWFLLDVQAATTIYRSQPFNSTTLTLTSSAPATVTIGVF